MARHLASSGATVRVADTRENPANLARWQKEAQEANWDTEFISGPFTENLLEEIDLVAISPGLNPQTDLSAILSKAQESNQAVVSEIELFARALAFLKLAHGYRPHVIAVTGTNGKTTVTNLTGLMCEEAGKAVRVAGNISPAALDVLSEALRENALPQIWVLELSSFQLWSTYTLNPDVAVVLNISQDHLDWHENLPAYALAKERIFGSSTTRVLNRNDSLVRQMEQQKSADQNIPVITFGLDAPVNAGDFGVINDNGMDWLCVMSEVEADEPRPKKNAPAPTRPHLQMLMPAAALQIRGRHNVSNALAAMALCRRVGISVAPLLNAVRKYRGEPHRLEPVLSINGVLYVDDSKGTNVGATKAAIEGLGSDRKDLVLIAGGEGKDQDFSALNEPVSKFVKTILLIGRDAPLLQKVFEQSEVPVVLCSSMEDAVGQATQIAREGDTVLLSPACASMDMFRNYVHRSQVFVSAVKEIALSRGEVVV
jgi:UDP-N-acetylmuramoylalanine--D-glutamate ligase